MFDQELKAQLNSALGERLRAFMKCTVRLLVFWAFALVAYQAFLLPGFGRLYVFFVIVRTLVHLVWAVIWLLIWKLSVMRIDGLRDRLRSHGTRMHAGDMAGCWPQVTRDYKAAVKIVDGLWRTSHVSLVQAFSFAYNITVSTFVMGVSQAIDPTRPANGPLGVFIMVYHTIIMCVALFLWARINSRCVSMKRASESLLYLAREHLGTVCREDTLDHLCFLEAVEEIPCGVEIDGVGLVSFKYVTPLLRIISIGIPVMVG
uniref:Uncharacterized protein n=1 Tax=Zooxanthella nutricula TaxID=1333877 RepID=A0A7S2N0V6_9DINO